MLSVDSDLTGRRVAQKYELVRRIGQGGMGAVYEAVNHLGKRFAVKLLLKAEFANDPQLAGRFFREAKASATIESEHIVEVYDTGVDAETGLPFIIMELLRGEDLEQLIGRLGALDPVAAVRIASQAAVGLGRAHAAGIIHRDIKPANVFLSARDGGDAVVKLLDFGIAKHTIDPLAATEGQGLTKTGSMIGTPLYMSPEQAQGAKNIDARSDVWSLSMCLYEALAGRTPFEDVDTLGKLILAICSRDVVPLQDLAPWVEPELARVVHAGLTRDPEQRIATAAQLLERLRPFGGGSHALPPEILTGVAEARRATTAPRAPLAQSVGAVTHAPSTRDTGRRRPGVAFYVALGAALFTVLAVTAFAVVRFARDAAPRPGSVGGSPNAPGIVASSVASTPSSAPPSVDAVKSATMTVRIPTGATLKVGKDDWTDRIVGGAITLRGEEGQQFLVSVWQGKRNLLTQKVFMGDGFVVPDEIDTAKGEQIVKAPTKAVGAPGPKPSTAATPGGKGASTTASAANKATADVPPKTKPTVETTFE